MNTSRNMPRSGSQLVAVDRPFVSSIAQIRVSSPVNLVKENKPKLTPISRLDGWRCPWDNLGCFSLREKWGFPVGRLRPTPPGTVLVLWALRLARLCQIGRPAGRHRLDLRQSGSPVGDLQLPPLPPGVSQQADQACDSQNECGGLGYRG